MVEKTEWYVRAYCVVRSRSVKRVSRLGGEF